MGVSNTKDALFVCLLDEKKAWHFPLQHHFPLYKKRLFAGIATKCEKTYEYLLKIPITHWWNTQWEITRELPLPERLPSRYGVVTSNTSECINAMIEDYRSEGWTELVEGTNRNMSKSKGWTLQSSLLTLWMKKTRANNQTKIDDNVNLLKTL